MRVCGVFACLFVSEMGLSRNMFALGVRGMQSEEEEEL